MKTLLMLFLLCGTLHGLSINKGLKNQMLIFPKRTVNSYVTLIPTEDKPLKEFTVCVRAYTDLSGYGYPLFSFATRKFDNEILLFRQNAGQYSVHVGQDRRDYWVPNTPMGWMHFCISWESETGLVGFWVDGNRFVSKEMKQGYTIPSNASIILGQEQDSYRGSFDLQQVFVGETADVQMWDHVLSSTEIHLASVDKLYTKGNFLDWETVQYHINGHVFIKPTEAFSKTFKLP